MFCKECGTEIREGIKFCPNCGANLGQTVEAKNVTATSKPVENAQPTEIAGQNNTEKPKSGVNLQEAAEKARKAAEASRQKFCPQCGTSVKPGAKFCPQCGGEIKEESETIASEPEKQKSPTVEHSDKMPSSNKKQKRSFVANWLGWILFVCVTIGGGVGLFFMYDELVYYKIAYIREERNARTLIDNDVSVVFERVYNAANNSEKLDHTKVTWLCFNYQIMKRANVSNSEKIYVKVIDPNETLLKTDESGTNDYSFTENLASRYSSLGTETPGYFFTQRGCYRIEFWYKDKCVGKEWPFMD